MGVGWLILAVVLVGGAAAMVWVVYRRNREVASEVRVMNPGAEKGTALVVYHPGKSSFQRQVFSGFAEGLAANGWRVAITTASSQAPADLDGYDLLVVGGPTYGFAPSWPVRRYVRRLGDLKGQRTVTITTGMGAAERSTRILEAQVREANGNLEKALLLYWMRPNDDDNHVDAAQNRALAVEMATQAGGQIPLPGE